MKQMWKTTATSHLVGPSYHEPCLNCFTRLVRVRSNYNYMSEQRVSRTAFSPYVYNTSTLK